METEGVFAFDTVEEARAAYERMGPAAQTVVRETAKAMEFDREEYESRVTGDVVETARDALFASLLEVSIGTDDEFEAWRERHDYEVVVAGSDEVDHVVWHAAPFAGEAAAATFQNEREAAVDTLRRQAFGRLYRDRL
ncbi:MAG: DUF5809 family protein [Haloferacaceae archaeon]